MKHNGMDERQMQINTKAMAIGGAFLALCVAASMIYKVITTEDMGWEFWALIGTCLVLLVSRNLLGDVEQPKDMLGRPLPTGNTKEEKRLRKRDYALGGLLFGGVCAAMDVLLIGFGWDDVTDLELTELLSPGLGTAATVAVTAVIALVSMFLISYGVEYFLGEKVTIRRYNKMLSELEADDE